MKLINKKDKKIKEGVKISIWIHGEGTRDFSSIADLNEQWEDYHPKEPVIKNEKVRKAVRAWADANGLFEDINITTLNAGTRFSIGHYDIEFIGYFIYGLISNKTYTIAELCGEDEE